MMMIKMMIKMMMIIVIIIIKPHDDVPGFRWAPKEISPLN